mgnify:FL=1
MLLHLKSNEFNKEVLQSNQPVLVDFSATWCGPCQMMGPVMEKLATEFEGKAKVAKVDIDECSDLAMQYHIMSVPSMLFFKNGEIKEQVVGAVPAEHLSEKLNSLL